MKFPIAVLLAFLALSPSALAAPAKGNAKSTTTTTTTTSTTTTSSSTTSSAAGGSTTSTSTSSASSFAPSGGILGSPDLLGKNDVSCSNLAGATAEVRTNCAASGTPQSAYPAGNYGLDVNVDTGITDPAGDFASIIQSTISAFYGTLSHVVGWLLAVLAWAFKLDVFKAGEKAMIRALGGSTQNPGAIGAFTYVLLPISFCILGIVAVGYWLRHEHAGMLAHIGVAVAIMAGVLFVALNPIGSLNEVDNLATNLSSGAVGAFDGQANGGGFANSEPALWKTAVEEPWCVAEFGSPDWCMSPPDSVMQAARTDVLANHLQDALGDQGTPQEAKQQEPAERARLNAAQTNGQLFLSFVTNANARNGLSSANSWTFAHKLNVEHPELITIRRAGGWPQRLWVLLGGVVVGLAFVLIVGFIVIQIVGAKFLAVALLLLSPVVILLPVTERGRRIALLWFGTLLGTFIRRVVYAIYLGVLVLLTDVIGAVASGQGVFVYWGLLFVLYVGAFMVIRKPLGAINPLPTGGDWVRERAEDRVDRFRDDRRGRRRQEWAANQREEQARERQKRKEQEAHREEQERSRTESSSNGVPEEYREWAEESEGGER